MTTHPPSQPWLHLELRAHTLKTHIEACAVQPRQLEAQAHNILTGEVAVHHHHPIKTVLGSCIAVCLYDPEKKIIGMNHFLVPLHHSLDDQEGYFSGMASMEVLINAMMKVGAQKRRLLAKAFGGGDMLGMASLDNIGQRNIDFTTEWLAAEGIPLVASDLGGFWARKVIFEPNNGDVFCRRIEAKLPRMRELAKAEAEFAAQLVARQKPARIDFFD